MTARTYRRSVEGKGEVAITLDRADLKINIVNPLAEEQRVLDMMGKAAEAIAISTAKLVMADARYRSKAAKTLKAAEGAEWARRNEVEASDWFLDAKQDVASAQADLEYAKGFMQALQTARDMCNEVAKGQRSDGGRFAGKVFDVGGGTDTRRDAHQRAREEVAERNRTGRTTNG